MEKDTKEKHALNPLLFKLAIPLALSLVGVIISTLTRKPKRRMKPTEEQHQMGYPESMSQYEFEDEEDSSEERDDEVELEEEEKDDEYEEETPLAVAHLLEKVDEQEISIQQCLEGSNSEEQIQDLRCLFASLEDRESILESQFYDYCKMREQESAFQKLQIMCLGLKLESLESQNQRLEGIVAEFRGATEQVDLMRAEIKLLRRKANKLNRANRECSNLIRQHAPIIQAKEEISGTNKEFHQETKESKEVADQLYKEIKAEEKLKRRALEQQMEERVVEDATRLDNLKSFGQLQQLRDQWSADMEELIYLGWINACLRREILIIPEEEEYKGNGYEEEAKPTPDLRDEVIMELPYDEHVENCSVEFCDMKYPLMVSNMDNVRTAIRATSSGRGSKKPRLLRKLKVWAIGKGRCKTICGNGKSLEGWPCSNS